MSTAIGCCWKWAAMTLRSQSPGSMTRLPPVRPNIDVPPSPSMADIVDKENPFEGSWGVLKALKTEVRDLQAALCSEQQLRDEEVRRLRMDLQDCRDELAREKQERRLEMQKVIDPVNAETAALKEDQRKVRALRDQQIREMQETMEDEKKERCKDVRELMERITQETTNRDNDVKTLSDSVAETQRLLDFTGNESRHCIRNLTQDLKLISDQMIRVNNTWGGFRSDCLVSHPASKTLETGRRMIPTTSSSSRPCTPSSSQCRGC